MKFDRKKFFDGFRPFYRSETGVSLDREKVAALEFLLTSFENSPAWTRVEEIAFALANIHIETYWPKSGSRYLPIKEGGGKAYFIRRYWTNKKIRTQLGNESEDDAWRRPGRGYIQETGLGNDIKFTRLTGIDLVNDPDLAMVPENAFLIMTVGMHRGIFTGKRLGTFINDSKTDYYNARTVINGHDRATEIAGIAHHIEQILRNALTSAATPAEQTLTDDNPTGDGAALMPSDGSPSVKPPPNNDGQPTQTDTVMSEKTTETGDKTITEKIVAKAESVGDKFQSFQGVLDKFGFSIEDAKRSVGTIVMTAGKLIFAGLLLVWGFFEDHPFVAISAALVLSVVAAIIWDRSGKRLLEAKQGMPVEVAKAMIEAQKTAG